MTVVPATTIEAALEMDVLLGTSMCGAYIRRLERQAAASQGSKRSTGGWQRRADGGETMHITDMSQLRSVMSKV